MISMRRNPYTLFGFLAICCWAFSIPVGRSILEKVGLLTGGSAIMILGGTLNLGVRWARGGLVSDIKSISRKYLLVCGTLFSLYMLVWYPAVGGARDHAMVLEVGLINYLWPAFTLLFSIPVLGRRANGWLIPGILAAFTGAALAIGQGSLRHFTGFADHFTQSPLPYVLAFIGALAWGLYSNFSRKYAPGEGSGAVPFFLLFSGFVLFIARMAAHEQSHWSFWGVAEIVFMCVISTLGYELWELAMRKGNHTVVAAASYMTPLLSTLLSGVILQVAVPAGIWLACGLIILGAVVCKMAVRE